MENGANQGTVVQHKALDAAKEKANAAAAKLSAMEAATDAREVKRLWSEFLTEVQRCYLRLIKATESGSTKAWCDRLKHTRRTDELLAYVEQARHADEHGVDPVSLVEAGSLTMGDPGEITIIKSGIITSQGFFGEMEGGTRRYRPAAVRLQAVHNRGRTYDLPRTHLGQSITDLGPLSAARMTIAYVRQLLAEAEIL